MSYVLADALELSGILSVFWCGITFNHYGAYSLSPYTTLTSRQLFRTLAFVCETSVFLYIGISIATIKLCFEWSLIVWTVVLCLIGRALHVFPICFVLNKFKKKKFSPQIQLAIWFAGLRGAIAFSLSLNLTFANTQYIRTATILFVHFTLFCMGTGTLPLLKVLGIKSGSSAQSLDNISKPREKTPHSSSSSNLNSSSSSSRANCLRNFVATIDEKYLKVGLRRNVPPLAREAVELFERLVTTSNETEMKPQRMIVTETVPKRFVSEYSRAMLEKGEVLEEASRVDVDGGGASGVNVGINGVSDGVSGGASGGGSSGGIRGIVGGIRGSIGGLRGSGASGGAILNTSVEQHHSFGAAGVIGEESNEEGDEEDDDDDVDGDVIKDEHNTPLIFKS